MRHIEGTATRSSSGVTVMLTDKAILMALLACVMGPFIGAGLYLIFAGL